MKGKLKVILLVISCLLLYGCGNTGVSQEEYDKVVAERDNYKKKFENIENSITINEKLVEYDVSVKKDYEKIQIMFDLYEAFHMDGVSVLRSEIDKTYKAVSGTISSAKATDMDEDTKKALDDMYITWNDACTEIMNSYNKILEILPQEP